MKRRERIGRLEAQAQQLREMAEWIDNMNREVKTRIIRAIERTVAR